MAGEIAGWTGIWLPREWCGCWEGEGDVSALGKVGCLVRHTGWACGDSIFLVAGNGVWCILGVVHIGSG